VGDVSRELPVVIEGGRHHPATPTELGWPGKVVDGDRTERTIRAFHSRWDELMAEPVAPAAVVAGTQ
jgi:hypothetical protein